MEIRGSCHCGAVSFRVDSPTPYPYQACYCSICRKTAGGGGYVINLGAKAGSLEVQGGEDITTFQAKIRDPDDPEREEISPAKRTFCRRCGSALWVYDPHWPELIHPFASAIDTPLPRPPEKVRIMLDFAAPWCELPEEGDGERHFRRFPEESIDEWHRRHGLHEEPCSKRDYQEQPADPDPTVEVGGE